MPLKYSLVKNHLAVADNECNAQPQKVRSHDLDSLIERMTMRDNFISKSNAIAVITNLFQTIADITQEGQTIHTDLFRTHFSISGTFEGTTDCFDEKRHSLNVNITAGNDLRKAASKIRMTKVVKAETTPCILQIKDNTSQTSNDIITCGGVVEVLGGRLKVQGDNEKTGIFFINDQNNTSYKVETIIENRPARLLIIAPPLPQGTYSLVIVTQSTRGGKVLKEPQKGRFSKVLQVQ